MHKKLLTYAVVGGLAYYAIKKGMLGSTLKGLADEFDTIPSDVNVPYDPYAAMYGGGYTQPYNYGSPGYGPSYYAPPPYNPGAYAPPLGYGTGYPTYNYTPTYPNYTPSYPVYAPSQPTFVNPIAPQTDPNAAAVAAAVQAGVLTPVNCRTPRNAMVSQNNPYAFCKFQVQGSKRKLSFAQAAAYANAQGLTGGSAGYYGTTAAMIPTVASY